jgi:hypothetical protein
MICCILTEFIEVGKPARALDTLYEVFRNKKWAYSWSESVLEPIMFKYLDLCVELKKSHIAKEGLFQYRNMFQSVSQTVLLISIKCMQTVPCSHQIVCPFVHPHVCYRLAWDIT